MSKVWVYLIGKTSLKSERGSVVVGHASRHDDHDLLYHEHAIEYIDVDIKLDT